MILVLNSLRDSPSEKFIELCNFKGLDYFQIEDGHEVSFDNIQIKNGRLKDFTIINKTSKKSISKDTITGFFYRKGRMLPKININFNINIKDSVKDDFLYCLMDEWDALVFYIFDWIEHNVPSIGSYNNIVPNKLKMLNLASNCGFSIPDTFIYSSIEKFENIFENGPYISKSIQDILVFENENVLYRSYTSHLKKDKILIDNYYSLFPSLIQKRINSRYEIRVFYFSEYIYAVAIAHEKNNNGKADYRNSENHLDIFPYVFSKMEEKKLKTFIKNNEYNSGSIDFLLSENNELFFLEINPVGQFDFVSDFCGKNIDIEIVNYFISKKKHNLKNTII